MMQGTIIIPKKMMSMMPPTITNALQPSSRWDWELLLLEDLVVRRVEYFSVK
jgi:hypothetical protein